MLRLVDLPLKEGGFRVEKFGLAKKEVFSLNS